MAQAGYFNGRRGAHLVEGGLLGHFGGDLVSTPGKAKDALHDGYRKRRRVVYCCLLSRMTTGSTGVVNATEVDLELDL